MKTIFTVLKKELKRVFTDPRMVIGLILPGLLIFILYTVLGDVITGSFTPDESNYSVYIENEPIQLKGMFDVEGWTVEILQDDIKKEEAIKLVQDKELDLVIIYEEDFYNKMISDDVLPKVDIFYNSASVNSSSIYSYTLGVLDVFEEEYANVFNINYDVDTKYDLATENDAFTSIMGSILPFILVIFLFSGAMSVCSEAIAGEKERGTIATLLVTPIKRRHLVIGKISALGITTIVCAFSSYAGLIFSFPKLIGGEFSFDVYSFKTLALILLVVIFTALLFTIILSIISTYAKSVKEANSLATPLMLVVSLVGMSGMFITANQSNLLLFLIPIYNSIQCFSGILNFTFDLGAFLVTIGANSIYIILGVIILSRMFESEKIIFNK